MYKGSVSYENGEMTLRVQHDKTILECVLFHEFTHLLDRAQFISTGQTTEEGLFCYTEYHAAQNEILQLLRASYYDDIQKYSIKKELPLLRKSTREPATLESYWTDKLQNIEKAIQTDKKDTVKVLDILTLIFNYWGIRSVIEMCCIDYNSDDYPEHAKFLDEVWELSFMQGVNKQEIDYLEQLLHGILNDLEKKEAFEQCQLLISTSSVPDE